MKRILLMAVLCLPGLAFPGVAAEEGGGLPVPDVSKEVGVPGQMDAGTAGRVVADQAGVASALPWETRNRQVVFSVEGVRRHYVEDDITGQTPDGILDEENGNLAGIAGRVRWQGRLHANRGYPLQLELEYRIDGGSTQYRGYLQSLQTGALIQPYNGSTRNLISDLRARAGLVLSGSDRLQFVPFAEGRMHLWYRDLGQYDETYQHDAVSLGALLQWQATPAMTLDIDASAGTTFLAAIDVPAFGVSQSLGAKPLYGATITAHWQLSGRFGLAAALRHERSAYGQSAVQNGFMEPSSTTEETIMQMGVTIGY